MREGLRGGKKRAHYHHAEREEKPSVAPIDQLVLFEMGEDGRSRMGDGGKGVESK